MRTDTRSSVEVTTEAALGRGRAGLETVPGPRASLCDIDFGTRRTLTCMASCTKHRRARKAEGREGNRGCFLHVHRGLSPGCCANPRQTLSLTLRSRSSVSSVGGGELECFFSCCPFVWDQEVRVSQYPQNKAEHTLPFVCHMSGVNQKHLFRESHPMILSPW